MINSANSSALSGVSAPQVSAHGASRASAGPSFHAAINSGKFHGMIFPPRRSAPGRRVSEIFRTLDPAEIGMGLPSIWWPSRHVAKQIDRSGQSATRGHGRGLPLFQALQLPNSPTLFDEVASFQIRRHVARAASPAKRRYRTPCAPP